ncbi:MAG: amino acid ABC transporter permease [Leptothrix sp. (in: b-proteobacteria)]
MSTADLLAIGQGAWTTLWLSAAGIALGCPIGLGLALLRWARVPVVARAVAVYVSLLRATPLVTLVLLLFFALPNLGIGVGPIAAGVLALTMNTAAFNCEIWRAALMDFPKEQIEAAQSVGMRRGLRFRRIVLPQIARVSLPGLINEMSLLIKVTPVLAVVGVVDITRAAVRIGAETYEPLPPFFVALAIYLPIVFALVSVQRWVERRLTRRDAGGTDIAGTTTRVSAQVPT